MVVRRTQVLTVRLTPGEVQLLTALRFSFHGSQAEVVGWAMEALCARIAVGESVQGVNEPAAAAVCSLALEDYRSEQNMPWRGRVAGTTLRETSSLSQGSARTGRA